MLSILRNIKPSVNKKIDNCSILSIKHAFNIYIDDDKNITKSLKPSNNISNNLSINDYDSEWFERKSIEHAICNYK